MFDIIVAGVIVLGSKRSGARAERKRGRVWALEICLLFQSVTVDVVRNAWLAMAVGNVGVYLQLRKIGLGLLRASARDRVWTAPRRSSERRGGISLKHAMAAAANMPCGGR